MEVWSAAAMGPERILPNSEDELGQEGPADGALPEVGGQWSGEDVEEEEGGDGGAEGDEDEENGNGGYYYQPLNQDPDGLNAAGEEQPEQPVSHAEQLQEVQERIEAMGLHLPQAPPPDSDEEQDPEGAAAAAAQWSHASIPMDADHVELVKRTMAAVALPSLGVPAWAQDISDDQWKDMVQHTLQTHQSSAGLRLPRKNNMN